MLKLVKSELFPTTEMRIIRMEADTRMLQKLPTAQIRAAYDHIEKVRDEISKLLDRVDGKHV